MSLVVWYALFGLYLVILLRGRNTRTIPLCWSGEFGVLMLPITVNGRRIRRVVLDTGSHRLLVPHPKCLGCHGSGSTDPAESVKCPSGPLSLGFGSDTLRVCPAAPECMQVGSIALSAYPVYLITHAVHRGLPIFGFSPAAAVHSRVCEWRLTTKALVLISGRGTTIATAPFYAFRAPVRVGADEVSGDPVVILDSGLTDNHLLLAMDPTVASGSSHHHVHVGATPVGRATAWSASGPAVSEVHETLRSVYAVEGHTVLILGVASLQYPGVSWNVKRNETVCLGGSTHSLIQSMSRRRRTWVIDQQLL